MNVDKERQILAFINSCQEPEDLLKLPLTHPQAYALCEYYRENGKLESLDKLLEVRGIGKRTLEKIEHWVLPRKMDRSRTPSRRGRSQLEIEKEFIGLVKNLLISPKQFMLAQKQLRQGEKAVAFFSALSHGGSNVLVLVSKQRILVFYQLNKRRSEVLFSCALSNIREQVGMFDLKGRHCSVMLLDHENSKQIVVSRVPIKIASRVKLLVDGPESVGPLPESRNSTKAEVMSQRHKAKTENARREVGVEYPRLPRFYIGNLYLLPASFFGIIGYLILIFHWDIQLGLPLSLAPLLIALYMIISVLFIRHRYNQRCFSKRLSEAHPKMTPAQIHRLLQHLEKHGATLPPLDGLNLRGYEKQTVAKATPDSGLGAPAGSDPDHKQTNSKRDGVDFTRNQAVWVAIIGYLVLYSPLYFLGKISYGWFIGCAVVGSILGVLVLLAALTSLLSGRKRIAIAVSVMALGVVIALSTAFGDLPRPNIRSNTPTKLSQSPATVMPSVPSQRSDQDTGHKCSDVSKLQTSLQGAISARMWGTVSSIELQPLDGEKFLLLITWKLSDSVAQQYWEFEYINLLIEWAQAVFTDNQYECIETVQSQMLVHMVSIYGGESWSLGIRASLSRRTASKVVNWHTFKVTLSQDPELFFGSVADDVLLNL